MTEVEVYRQPAEVAVRTPSDIDSWTQVATQVIKLANEICDTPFVPDGLRGSVPATAAAILSGRELGLGPMTSLANIHVIKGKPALSAALMRALILAQGHQIETVSVTDTRVVVRGRRRGEATWEDASFDADQAKRAGIVLGGYPQDKLYARATSRLARRKFADVIAGMPYAAEELEDGDVADDGEVPAPAAAAAIEPAKPRTAQRKTRTSPPPAPAATTPAATPSGAGGDRPPLPPLPGEEDAPGPQAAETGPGATAVADYDTPGTATLPQITAVWTLLSQVYEFGRDEKDQARGVCSSILRRELESTKDMSRNEVKTVLDTLSHWRDQAQGKGEHPRDYMTEMLVALDKETPDGE